MRSLSFTRSSLGARDLERATERRARRQHRQLVDQARDLVGADDASTDGRHGRRRESPTGSPAVSPVTSTVMRAPMRSSACRNPSRWGLRQTPSMRTLDPGRAAAAAAQTAAEDGSPGTTSRSAGARRRLTACRLETVVPSWRDLQAERRKSAFRMISCRQRLAHDRRAARAESRKQDRALDLGARDRHAPVDGLKRRRRRS